jgi:DNA-binding NtrC family response regulator/predicted TIM-barrel enzyme
MSTRNKNFLFAAVVGSGLTAKAADKAGADYLLALNAGRFRVQGASSLTSFLPVRPANDWVVEFAEREMLGRCSAPIYAGFSVSDPTLGVDTLVSKAKKLGFSGVCNFPSTTLIDGRLGALLEREGLGFSREIELVEKAARAGLGTFVYVQTNAQARKMVDAGASAICANIGFTSGATGVSTHLSLQAAAALIERALDGVPASVDKLCHGGPITSPEAALAVTRLCGVQGFVAGSTLDRIPLEQTLNEVTQGFTSIPRLSRVKAEQSESEGILVGSSRVIKEIREDLDDLAYEDIPVLIVGETGTGKSLAARRLHAAGPSASRQSVFVDCPALGNEEGGEYLLGTAPSARTGSGGKRGALEQASGSTIIFEEIASLCREHQGKLLKFADEKTIQRIGDHSLRKTSARIVATSTQELQTALGKGGFRQDLYHRISGHEIKIPPLRERVDDIPELAIHLGRTLRSGEVPKFSNAAMRLLLDHHWPGNVRELGYAIKRAFRNAGGATIDIKALDFLQKSAKPPPLAATDELTPDRAYSERDWLAEALKRNGYKRSQTAEDLGMTTRTLYNKIKKYGLQS